MSRIVAESKEKELARKFVAAIGAGVLFFDFDKVLTTKDIPPHLTEIFKNTPEPYVLAILGFESKIKVKISPEEKTALEENFKKELGDLFSDTNLFREIFAEIERKSKKAGIVSAQDNSETAKALYLSRIVPVSPEEQKAGELSLLSIERAGTAQASRHELF